MTDPIIPTVDAAQYAADRVTVYRSDPVRIDIAGVPHTLVAEDWPTPGQCRHAVSRACLAITMGSLPCPTCDAEWDLLANYVAKTMGVDLGRPYGCSLIAEPV